MHRIVVGLENCVSKGTDILYSGYLRLPSISARVDSLRPYLPSFLLNPIESISFLSPKLINAKLNALIAKLKVIDNLEEANPLLEKAEYFCSYHQLSPFNLITLYVEKGMCEKAKTSIEKCKLQLLPKQFISVAKQLEVLPKQFISVAKQLEVLPKQFISVAKQLEEKIEKLEKKDGKKLIELLDIVLKEALVANDYKDPSRQQQELQTENRVTIAKFYQNQSNVNMAAMVLNQSKVLLDQIERQEINPTNSQLRILYQYASTYFSINEELLSSKYLDLLETKMKDPSKVEQSIRILCEFAQSQKTILLKWQQGQQFLKSQVNTIFNQIKKEDDLLALATICTHFPLLEEKGIEILKKLEVDKVAKPLNLLKLYRNFKIDFPEGLKKIFEEIKDDLLTGKIFVWNNFDLIEKILDDLVEQKNSDQAIKFLNAIGTQVSNVVKTKQILFVEKMVVLYQKLGIQQEGVLFFNNFIGSNPCLEAYHNTELIENTKCLMKIGQKEYATTYYSRFMKGQYNSDPLKLAKKLVDLYCEFNPDEASKIIKGAEAAVQKKYFYSLVPSMIKITSFALYMTSACMFSRSALKDRLVTWYRQKISSYSA